MIIALEFALTVLICAVLYRVPRGTGLGPVVLAWLPWREELIWALGCAFTLWLATGSAWAWAAVPLLMLGEAPGWSRWWPNDDDYEDDVEDFIAHSLRGCLLLNPFMGLIYSLAYTFRARLNHKFPFDGWTAWAEFACGAVTGAAYFAIFKFLG